MNIFKNLTISKKLLFSFVFLAIVSGIAGVISTSSIIRVDRAYTDMQKNMTNPLATLAEMSKLLQRERINLRDMILADTKEEQAIYVERLTAIRNQIDSLSSEYANAIYSQEMKEAFLAFSTALQNYIPESQKLEQTARAGDIVSAERLLRGDAFIAVKEVETELDNLVHILSQQAKEVSAENSAITSLSTIKTVTMLIIVMITALGLGFLLSRLIAHPLKELDNAARAVANGDLDIEVASLSGDEIGSLSGSFNIMVGNIKGALDEVNKEKAAVERKVEEAIYSSESQREELSKSVEKMLLAIEQFASGNLTVSMEVKGNDDISKLFSGFNNALLNIREMLQKVESATHATTSAAFNINQSGEELSILANEQLEESKAVFLAVEEMVQTIADNSQTASHMAEVTSQNGETAREGGEVVQQTVEKIKQIAEVVNDSASTIEHLGQSCQQIGEIVHVIDEIANQTNLLALNAAIEAARAGDHGKGFAVVADEVRKLAERTSDATNEIAQMIHNIQNESEKAVDAMQIGITEVNEGIQLADNAGRALSQVVKGVSDTVNNITQIAAASEEQSVKSQQISEAIERISSVSNRAAEGIQKIASEVMGMNQLTEQLDGYVSRFNIGTPEEQEEEFEAMYQE